MKKVLIILGIIIALGLGSFLIVSLTSDDDEPTNSGSVSVTTQENVVVEQENTSPQKTSDSYTAEEVAQHSNSSDCWTIINGQVYDLTEYVSSHPGGDEIARACGVDGTTLFESRETESGQSVGSGTSHSSSANRQLEQLKIGTLAN